VSFIDVGIGFFVNVIQTWARFARRKEEAWLD